VITTVELSEIVSKVVSRNFNISADSCIASLALIISGIPEIGSSATQFPTIPEGN